MKLTKRYFFVVAVLCFFLAPQAFAAISHDGYCVGTNSCTFTGTTAGDLKVIFETGTTAGAPLPPTPPGWTIVATGVIGTFGFSGSSSTWVIACNVSSGSSDTASGNWQPGGTGSGYNGKVFGSSFAGTAVGTNGNCNTTGIGAYAQKDGTASVYTFNGLALRRTDGTANTYFSGGPDTIIPIASNASCASYTTDCYSLFAGRYFKYRMTLYSDVAHNYTPTVSGVTVNWSP